MVFVTPPRGKALVDDGPHHLRVTVPPSRPPFMVGFLCFWLASWIAIGGFVLFLALPQAEPGPPALVMIPLQIGWALGVIVTTITLLWSLSGHQIISIEKNLLSVRWSLLGLAGSREFSVDHIAKLRVDPFSSIVYLAIPRGVDFWRLTEGPLAFDYGAATVRFGHGLTEAEAVTVKWKLAARLPPTAAG